MFEELKTFITVVDCKNFTKAAENLNLSQPSVSTHIKNLEAFFEVTLINRSVKQKSISITESGYVLYKRAKEILNIFNVTVKEVKELTDSVKGVLKIGASSTIGEYILPKFISEFYSKYPEINIEVLIDNTYGIATKLKNMNLDVGIVEGSVASAYFNQEYFLDDKMVLAVPYDSGIKKSNLNINDLQNKNWVAREYGSSARQYLNLFLSRNKLIPQNVTVLGSNFAIKEAVRDNVGITIMSNIVIDEYVDAKKVSIYELDDNFNRYFSFIYLKDTPLSTLANIFIEELKNYSMKL